MLFRHSMIIAQLLMTIYNITVYNNNIYITLNVVKTVGAMKHQYTTKVVFIQKDINIKEMSFLVFSLL